MSTIWNGVIPAVTTPFNEDLTIDHVFLTEHIRWMIIRFTANEHGRITPGGGRRKLPNLLNCGTVAEVGLGFLIQTPVCSLFAPQPFEFQALLQEDVYVGHRDRFGQEVIRTATHRFYGDRDVAGAGDDHNCHVWVVLPELRDTIEAASVGKL